jgi:cytochrome b561
MNTESRTALSYDTKSIWLHWITAAIVILLLCVGQTIDWFPRGIWRTTVRSLHISTGSLLGLIVLYRIWWRVQGGRRLPPANVGLTQTLTKTVHLALYAAVLATVILGAANVWVRGDTLFNLLTVPAFDPGNKALRHQVEELHQLAAYLVLIVAALHAGAALLHHYVRKDEVLRRMLPERGAQSR